MPASLDAIVALQVPGEEITMGFMSRALGMASGRRGTAAAPAKGRGRRRSPGAGAGGGKGRVAGKAFKALRGRGKI